MPTKVHPRMDSADSTKKFAISIKGGIARSLSSIGVIRFFQENDLKPEVIAGSSAGSIVAGMYALGMNWNDMLSILENISPRNYFKFTAPIREASFISMPKFREGFKRIISKDINIEDLPQDLVVFATDAETADRVYLTSGDLVTAMMASSAFPVLLPAPIKFQGRYLIDGDLSNSYSCEYLKSKYEVDLVIGVGAKNERKPFVENSGLRDKFLATYDILMKQVECKNDPIMPEVEIIYPSNGQGLFDYKDIRKYSEFAYNYLVETHSTDIFRLLTAKDE